MTRESELLFRHGTRKLFRTCGTSTDVDMLIVSAGIYELIDQSLRLFERDVAGDDFSSIRILSNQFSYD